MRCCVCQREREGERDDTVQMVMFVFTCAWGVGETGRGWNSPEKTIDVLCVDIIIKSVAARIDRLLPEHPLGRYRQVYTK